MVCLTFRLQLHPKLAIAGQLRYNVAMVAVFGRRGAATEITTVETTQTRGTVRVSEQYVAMILPYCSSYVPCLLFRIVQHVVVVPFDCVRFIS